VAATNLTSLVNHVSLQQRAQTSLLERQKELEPIQTYNLKLNHKSNTPIIINKFNLELVSSTSFLET